MAEDYYDDDTDELVVYSTVGRTITAERLMTREEMRDHGWGPDHIPTALVLDDGTVLVPASDPYEERSGALIARLPNGKKLLIEQKEERE